MDIEKTIELHNAFFQRIGSVEGAATLALVHTLLQQPADKPVPADVLTVAEAADAMKTSNKLVYALCASGRLRHQRIGTGRGMIRIQRADLAKIITESTHEADDGLALFRQHAAKPNARRARRQGHA